MARRSLLKIIKRARWLFVGVLQILVGVILPRFVSHPVLYLPPLIVGTILTVVWSCLSFRRKVAEEEDIDDEFDQIPGIPKRYSYEELKQSTRDFQNKLGQGGFGSVFEGSLKSGERIAVKRLDALGQGKKEFLAEVKTIGSIHHVNLVRLVGFCAERLNRLLVYELMSNGSLDKWIFNTEPSRAYLDWPTRRAIILDVARGLAYLHEECTQRIIHLDIKPQNILLDGNLHAKISDFGLSKLIERDQSQVVTTMRGTPGYMAPEWFSSVITEKVDVYSFGIVLMETVCGRKNLDKLEHLLPIFMKKASEDELIDMVDIDCHDIQSHASQAVELMRLAVWCLQRDFTRRPSMSTVVKVLEGMMDVPHELDHQIHIDQPITLETSQGSLRTPTSTMPDYLSGPR